MTSALTGTAANVEAYAYNATGNRLSKQVGGSAVVPYAYPGALHRLHAVGGVVRSYDAAGNTTQMPSATAAPLTLVYDARNRLARVDGGTGSLYTNHCNGRAERVRNVAGTVDARYFFDERGQLRGEYDSAGTPRRFFVWMDETPVLVVEGATLRYIETDHLNTPRALIDPARNLPVWRWELHGSAFGENAANEDPDGDGTAWRLNLRFPGQYLDAEAGLHYNYFRDYEPGSGRYVESDPIGLFGGLGTYAYADGLPLSNVDPDGLSPQAGMSAVAALAVCLRIPACRQAVTEAIKACKNVRCKVSRHKAHHKFEPYGYCEHVQIVCWINKGPQLFRTQFRLPGRCRDEPSPGDWLPDPSGDIPHDEMPFGE